jgi:hypothetical protein
MPWCAGRRAGDDHPPRRPRPRVDPPRRRAGHRQRRSRAGARRHHAASVHRPVHVRRLARHARRDPVADGGRPEGAHRDPGTAAAASPPWDLGPIRALVGVPDAPSLASLLAGPAPLPGTHLCLAPGTYPGFTVPPSWSGVVLRSGSFTAAGLVDAPQAAVVTGNVHGPGARAAWSQGFWAHQHDRRSQGRGGDRAVRRRLARHPQRRRHPARHGQRHRRDAATTARSTATRFRDFANNGIMPKPGRAAVLHRLELPARAGAGRQGRTATPA